MRANRANCVVFALLASALVTLVAAVAVPLSCVTSAAEDAWKVEVEGGGKTIVLTRADLERMQTVVAEAGFKKTTGKIEGPLKFKGVYMDDLLAKVGGIGPAQAIRVTARDGYAMTYTYAQLGGNVLTYGKSGDVLRTGGVTMILAYESEDDAGAADKLPRIVYVAKDRAAGPPITDGHFWTKAVAKIEVVSGVEDWVIKLGGVEQAVLDRSTFESTVNCPKTPHSGVVWETTDKQGNKEVYEGLPLWVVISMMDGGDAPGGHYRFNDDLARQGYKVRVVSKDGYGVELEAALVARNNNIILAYKKDGGLLPEESAPLMLAGKDLPSRKYMVKQIAELHLVDLPAGR
ncbi:MAG: hypothetical protein QME92_12050 [Bacillota bacterium]|nr:hypothetical protein [Bacillota bacterium]